MSRFAQATPDDRQELTDEIDDLHTQVRTARRKLAALELVLTHMFPAIQEAHRLTSTSYAVHHALEVYQGGAAGGPVADLQRALGRTLMELRDLLEANLRAPSTHPEPPEFEDIIDAEAVADPAKEEE